MPEWLPESEKAEFREPKNGLNYAKMAPKERKS